MPGNLSDISQRALHVLRHADLVLAEDTRHTRKLFSRYGLSTPMQSYHEHNERQRAPDVVQRVLQGSVVALVSDAGTCLSVANRFHMLYRHAGHQRPGHVGGGCGGGGRC